MSVDMINLLPTCKFIIPNIQISRSGDKADGVVVLVSDGGDGEAEIHLYGVIEREREGESISISIDDDQLPKFIPLAFPSKCSFDFERSAPSL